MAKGQEESDDLVVPEDRRKTVPTAQHARGGKEVTASEVAGQLGLFRETAGSPKGAGDGRGAGEPAPNRLSVSKSRTTKRNVPLAMTMEEVAEENNLRRAFAQVASNKGAPGPDKQSIHEVREHLTDVLSSLDEVPEPFAFSG